MNRLEQYIASLAALVVTVPALMATNAHERNDVAKNSATTISEYGDAGATVNAGRIADMSGPPGITPSDRLGVNQDSDSPGESRPWGTTANAALMSVSNYAPQGIAALGTNLLANSSMIAVEDATTANASPGTQATDPDNTIVTPEPASLSLLVMGGAGLLGRRRYRQARA